jgi:flagellar biosynthesis/type III secretory pathway chaperone
LCGALERIADALDAETAAVRTGEREQLATTAERKRLVIEAVEPVIARAHGSLGSIPASQRAQVQHAATRLQAACARNGEALSCALEATRRVLDCFAEAAKAASMTGTYGPDGRARPASQAHVTIERSA